MVCKECKSENFKSATVRLRKGTIQKVTYCDDCGQIVSRTKTEPPEKPAHISFSQRKAMAEAERANQPKKLKWSERKALAAQKPVEQQKTEQPTEQQSEGEVF